MKATVLKNYDAKDSEQVSVLEEQKLIVIGKEGYREGWLKVKCENREVGTITLYNSYIFLIFKISVTIGINCIDLHSGACTVMCISFF